MSTLPRKIYCKKETSKLKSFNSEIQLCNSISNDLIGPTLAGFLISISVISIFYGIVFLVLISLFLISRIDFVFDNDSTKNRRLNEFKLTNNLSALLVLSTLLSFCFGMYGSIFVIHARTTIGISSQEFGILLSLFSVGCILHKAFPRVFNFTDNNFLIGLLLIMISNLISIIATGMVSLSLAQVIAGYGFMKWIIEESNFKLISTKEKYLEAVGAKFRIWETAFFSIGALISGVWLHFSPATTSNEVYTLILILEILFILPLTLVFYTKFAKDIMISN